MHRSPGHRIVNPSMNAGNEDRQILMIAFHFPRESSGLQRSLGSARHLSKMMHELIGKRKIQDIVRTALPVPFLDALKEMMSTDGLSAFQGYTPNPAIPA